MYYKLINGVLHKMVMPIRTENGLYLGNSSKIIENAGYKRLIKEPAPVAEGYTAVPYWEEKNGGIIQRWHLVSADEGEVTE